MTTEYPETHPVGYLESIVVDYGTAGMAKVPARVIDEVKRLVSMWKALDAQTRAERLGEPVPPCIRCELVQKLFPIAEPAPLDAATVKAWIDARCK